MNIQTPQPKEKWKHFKGKVYTIVAVARDAETQDLLIVYKDKKGEVWVRPISNFLELVFNKPIPGLGPSMNYSGQRFVPV